MAKTRDFILQHIVIRTLLAFVTLIQYTCYMYHTRNSQRIRLVALLAHTEQSAHQTSNPNIDIDICVHTYSPLLNNAFPVCL